MLFVYPRALGYLRVPLDVVNAGDVPAGLADDGDTLRITVPADRLVVASTVPS